MKQRIITACLGCLVLVPTLLFSGTFFFCIMTGLCAVVGVWELCSCLGVGKKAYYLVPSMIYAGGVPFAPLYLRSITVDLVDYLFFFAVVTLVYFLCMLLVIVLRGGEEPFSLLAELVLGSGYTALGFFSIVLIRQVVSQGVYLFALVFVAAWITDTMAYFTGYFFGKHKLCPKISPKKTIEGSIGGTICCTGIFALYGWIVGLLGGGQPNYWMLAALGLVLSVLSQIGDLSLSLLKREHGIKDFGNIMPGHGGILDRFDSFLAVAPAFLLACYLPENFSLFL